MPLTVAVALLSGAIEAVLGPAETCDHKVVPKDGVVAAKVATVPVHTT